MASLELCDEKHLPGDEFILEGRPIALTHSTIPSLVGKFLCVVDKSATDVTPTQRSAAMRALQFRSKEQGDMKSKQKKATNLEALANAIMEKADPSGVSDLLARTAAGSKRPRLDGGAGSLAPVASEGVEEEEDDKKEEEAEEEEPDTEGGTKSIELPIGSFFEALPKFSPEDPEGRDSEYRSSWYIPGPAGAGKSVFAAGLIRKYAKMWPRNHVFGICKTRLSDDKAYKDVRIHQVPVAVLAKQNVSKEEGLKRMFGMQGSLVLFDDWDSFDRGTDRAVVLALIKDILNLGRKMRISILVTSHQLSNYIETKAIISESEYVTLFPRDPIEGQLNYLLSKMGFDNKVLNAKMMKRMGRAVTLHKYSPIYVLSESQCMLMV